MKATLPSGKQIEVEVLRICIELLEAGVRRHKDLEKSDPEHADLHRAVTDEMVTMLAVIRDLQALTTCQ